MMYRKVKDVQGKDVKIQADNTVNKEGNIYITVIYDGKPVSVALSNESALTMCENIIRGIRYNDDISRLTKETTPI